MKFLVLFLTLGGIQLATSFAYQAQARPITAAGNDFNVGNGQEATPNQTPNQEDKLHVVKKIDADDASKTAVEVNNDQIQKEDISMTSDVPPVSEHIDDVAETTPLPFVDVAETKEKENTDTTPGEKETDKLEATMIFIASQDKTSSNLDDTSDEDETAQVDPSANRCMRARCGVPPAGQYCRELSPENVPKVLTGIAHECCPIHICHHEDGSTYFHYGIEVEDNVPTSQLQHHSSPFIPPNSLGFRGNMKNGPVPPARPMNLPPFLSSLLPPMFPLGPPPPAFYNAASLSSSGRQAPSAHNILSAPMPTMGGLLFPPLSGGAFHPGTSMSSFQINLPSQNNNARFLLSPSSDASVRQSPPMMQLFSKQTAPDSSANVDRTVKTFAMENWGNAPMTTKFSSVMSSSFVPFGPNAVVDDAQRGRRNPFAPVFGPGSLPNGFLPFRPGGLPF